jgi:hypothetical protein
MMNGSKKNDKRKAPGRSELGEVVYYSKKVDIDVVEWGKTKKKQVVRGYLTLWAVGPKGVYFPAESPYFEIPDTTTTVTGEMRAARDRFYTDLWNDGWQPSSIGKNWYQCFFRRVVEEPQEAEDNPETASLPAGMFREMEAKYVVLRSNLASGKVNPDQYRTGMLKLTIADKNGQIWMIDAQSGKWLLWNGKSWQMTEPPRA